MKKLVILIVVCILMSLISGVSSAEGQNNDDPQWMVAGNLAEYPENRWGQVWPQDAFLLKPAPNGSVTGYYGLQTIIRVEIVGRSTRTGRTRQVNSRKVYGRARRVSFFAEYVMN